MFSVDAVCRGSPPRLAPACKKGTEQENKCVTKASADALHGHRSAVIGYFDRPNGLLHENVGGLYQDRRGRLWIGSNEGVMFYANGRFTDLHGI